METKFRFEWDLQKELKNMGKHGYFFEKGTEVFSDPSVIHLKDVKHSEKEERYYAVGRDLAGTVLTVRYTRRGDVVRIFGVADWRKWRRYYENTRSL